MERCPNVERGTLDFEQQAAVQDDEGEGERRGDGEAIPISRGGAET